MSVCHTSHSSPDHANIQTKHSTSYAQRCKTDGIKLQRRRRLVGSQDGAARLLIHPGSIHLPLLQTSSPSLPHQHIPTTLDTHHPYHHTSRLIFINSRYSLFASIFTLVQAVSPNESDSDPMDTFSRFSNLYFTS